MTDKISVLLIEDNPGDQLLVEDQLQNDCPGKFVITSVTTLKSAMDMLDEHNFGAVLTDLSLPDGFGLDSIHEIQKLDDELPVIVLTGEDGEEVSMQVMQAGAQDYLIKGQGDGHLIGRTILYSMERKRNERRLVQLAQYDSLTGLANRLLFRERLSRALIRAPRQNCLVALMFIDLDRFKNINDTLGHDAGDNLLKYVANRLKNCMRKGDTVARLGGDEFTVILEDLDNVDDVAPIARKMLVAMQKPFNINGHEIFVTPSIGITLYPLDGTTEDIMLKNADTAMYQAKEHGRNCFKFYESSMHKRTIERLLLESKLRSALENQEFFLQYQPKVDFTTKDIIGVEALIRWNHPELGLVSPAEFIPLAEETGLIVPIGEWVIKTACKQVASWKQQGISSLRMAVNLSARQFRNPDITKVIFSSIEQANILASELEIEITESVLMEDSEHNNVILQELKAKGIHISMDDFGTGYSSLSYLKRLNVDTLKIDRSFVNDLLTDPEDAVIAEAIIALGHSLRLNIVAEGVETEEQFDFLDNLKCNQAQGFLFSKPLSADDLARYVLGDIEEAEARVVKLRAAQ